MSSRRSLPDAGDPPPEEPLLPRGWAFDRWLAFRLAPDPLRPFEAVHHPLVCGCSGGECREWATERNDAALRRIAVLQGREPPPPQDDVAVAADSPDSPVQLKLSWGDPDGAWLEPGFGPEGC